MWEIWAEGMTFVVKNTSSITFRVPHVLSLTATVTQLVNEIRAFYGTRRFIYFVQKSLALDPIQSHAMQS